MIVNKANQSEKDLILIGRQIAFLCLISISESKIDFLTAFNHHVHHGIEALTVGEYCDGVQVRNTNFCGDSGVVLDIKWDYSSPDLKRIKDDIYSFTEDAASDVEKEIDLSDLNHRLSENASYFLSEFNGSVNSIGAKELIDGLVIRLIDVYEIPHYPSAINLLRKLLLTNIEKKYKATEKVA